MEFFTNKINLFIGHYGTGKTTISVNLAHRFSGRGGEQVSIADIDVNNPYFRSRDFAGKLSGRGIDLIIPDKEIAYAEMPFLPARIYGAFRKEGRLIMDAGGYDTGTSVLGSLASALDGLDYGLWFVANIFRPGNETAGETADMYRRLEGVSRLKVSGIINNSNLADFTKPGHIIEGEKVVSEAAALLGKEYINCVDEKLTGSLEGQLHAPLFKISRLDQLDWQSTGGSI